MTYIIETSDLTKIYGKEYAIENINIHIKKGRIYGLIGPNGAGKTTLIRILSGLSFSTSGSITINGCKNKKDLEKQRKEMSFMIEIPYMDHNMTAYQNLMIQGKQRGISDKNRINEVLCMTGLDNTGEKKVKDFSLGMRQRLGIANALLSGPKVLIMDEPINGLDPNGIVEVRKFIKKLNDEYGITIIISSHNLEELYQVASDYILINNGKLVEELTSEELHKKSSKHILINTTDNSKTLGIIQNTFNVGEVSVTRDGTIEIYEPLDNIEYISKTITDAGIVLLHLSCPEEKLEDYYMQRIGGIKID